MYKSLGERDKTESWTVQGNGQGAEVAGGGGRKRKGKANRVSGRVQKKTGINLWGSWMIVSDGEGAEIAVWA